VSLLFLRTPLQEIRAATPLRLLADIAEGVRALRALTFVRASALAVAAANLIWSGLNRPGACSPPPSERPPLLVFAAWQALVAAVSLSTRSLRRAHA
jgi:hypothetical protein